MAYKLQYVCNEQGKRLAVIIPIRTWRSIEKKLKVSEFETKLRRDLVDSFRDIQLHRAGKKKLKTLDELLSKS